MFLNILDYNYEYYEPIEIVEEVSENIIEKGKLLILKH
jgi:hypothetical protein